MKEKKGDLITGGAVQVVTLSAGRQGKGKLVSLSWGKE